MLSQTTTGASPAPDRLPISLVGTTAAQYEITARVGRGGMGDVYKAHDRRLDRPVALKFVSSHVSRDELARQRLIVEAQITASMSHRNVCAALSLDATSDGQLFMVMPYYEGETLKQKLEGGFLGVVEALDFAIQIAEGLAYIHGKGIVHGDIKPSNLIVTNDGLRIIDFGLARGADDSPASTAITGSVRYASPEQTRGRRLDARSDIWSAGVVLYEMLAGRVPFDGAYTEAISYSIRHDPAPSLARTRIELSAELRTLVFKTLEKRPSERFQSAGELAAELRTIRAQVQQQTDGTRTAVGSAAWIGRHISQYRIDRILGIGGMGMVYEAEHMRSHRKVAIKVVADAAAASSDELRRLKREAEIIARLNHPHICAFQETFEHEGRFCVVMERLDGCNLKQHLSNRTLATSEIIDIAVQITEALEAVHAIGIVHRDIKPGNVFVDRNGVVKLLDFGLATRFQLDDAGCDDPTLEGSTIPGRPLGTANYMAPERILQTAPDPRSDLFSVGVLLYEMATERLPFGAATTVETITNVFDKDPARIRTLAPRRPAALDHIVKKLLAKRASQRYRSAAALRRALQRIRSAERRVVDRGNTFALPGDGGRHGRIKSREPLCAAERTSVPLERPADVRARAESEGGEYQRSRSAARTVPAVAQTMGAWPAAGGGTRPLRHQRPRTGRRGAAACSTRHVRAASCRRDAGLPAADRDQPHSRRSPSRDTAAGRVAVA
jgi:serine/threonine protein kinase